MCKRCPTVVVESYLEPGYFFYVIFMLFVLVMDQDPIMEYHKFAAPPRQKAKEKQDEEFPWQRQRDAMGNPHVKLEGLLGNSSII